MLVDPGCIRFVWIASFNCFVYVWYIFVFVVVLMALLSLTLLCQMLLGFNFC